MSNVSNLKSSKKLKPNQFLLEGNVITERGTLFSTEMVKANLEDRKTRTRRTKGLSLNVNGIPKKDWEYTECFMGVDPKENLVWMASAKHIPTGQTYADICPYGMPGDLLYVRETWMPFNSCEIDSTTEFDEDGIPETEYQVEFGYKAGGRQFCKVSEDFYDKMYDLIDDMEQSGETWKPSIHLPKSGSRIWVVIEDIRVERLQEISEEDALCEGVRIDKPSRFTGDAYVAFLNLWESINGKDSWLSNPWVWVIQYRILSKTGRPSDAVISTALRDLQNPPCPTPQRTGLSKGGVASLPAESEALDPKATDTPQPTTDHSHA